MQLMTPDAAEVLARISFKPVVDDYAAVYALSLTQSTNAQRWKAQFILCVASWSATAVSLLTAGAMSIHSAVTGAFCSAVMILVFTAKWWPDPAKSARQRYSASQNPELFNRRTIELEELGVRHLTEMSNWWFSWKCINRVILTEQHLFITSNTIALFVPVRAFVDRDQFLSFARLAQARYTPVTEESRARGFEVVMKNGSGDQKSNAN
jgi:hypothetical protein